MRHYIAFVVLGLACVLLATSVVAKVEDKIWKNLEKAKTTNVKVSFGKANIKDAFERFKALKLTSRNDRLNGLHTILKQHANIIQAGVTSVLNLASLRGKKYGLAQLWLSNELIVRDIDKEMVKILRDHPDVSSLGAERFIPLYGGVKVKPNAAPRNTTSTYNQWGVVNVAAPEVWKSGTNGAGTVVGIIDTGVRGTHVALRKTYRGNQPGQNHNYNWYDPTRRDEVPTDYVGHGTHVTGSIAGTNGIGVAPGSHWIACRGCTEEFCSTYNLIECGNWMTCPTNVAGGAPDCTKAPKVVNNSWGSDGDDSWYDHIIAGWREVGIVPVFAAGNEGRKSCQTLGTPGNRPMAISVGAIDSNNFRADFSSIGPTLYGKLNPFIAAPGADIVSASYLDDTSFTTKSGTSMAAPHLSGVVALLFSRNRHLTVPQVTAALKAGAIPHAPVGDRCGGIPDNIYPNNHVGHGRIWAPAAVNSVKKST